jgi:hypothetical protein
MSSPEISEPIVDRLALRAGAYLPSLAGMPSSRRAAVATAAAYIESAIELQGLSEDGAPPDDLLVADLYLARALRLLADAAGQEVQCAMARAIEQVAAEAAAGAPVAPLRARLQEAILSGGRQP